MATSPIPGMPADQASKQILNKLIAAHGYQVVTYTPGDIDTSELPQQIFFTLDADQQPNTGPMHTGALTAGANKVPLCAKITDSAAIMALIGTAISIGDPVLPDAAETDADRPAFADLDVDAQAQAVKRCRSNKKLKLWQKIRTRICKISNCNTFGQIKGP